MSRARWMLVASATGFASCTGATPAVNGSAPQPDAARNAGDVSVDAAGEVASGQDATFEATADATSDAQDVAFEATAEVGTGTRDAFFEARGDAFVGTQDAPFETSADGILTDALVDAGPDTRDLDGTTDALADANDEGIDADPDAPCPPDTIPSPYAGSPRCFRKWEGCPDDGGSVSSYTPVIINVSDGASCPVGYAQRSPTECQRTACTAISHWPACIMSDGGISCGYGVTVDDHNYACCWIACYGAPPARLDRLA